MVFLSICRYYKTMQDGWLGHQTGQHTNIQVKSTPQSVQQFSIYFMLSEDLWIKSAFIQYVLSKKSGMARHYRTHIREHVCVFFFLLVHIFTYWKQLYTLLGGQLPNWTIQCRGAEHGLCIPKYYWLRECQTSSQLAAISGPAADRGPNFDSLWSVIG